MFKKIILGARQTGKSTYLIKKCNIPMPITFRDFIAGKYNPDITKFYFDELQISLQNLACGREINTVVIGGKDLDVTLSF